MDTHTWTHVHTLGGCIRKGMDLLRAADMDNAVLWAVLPAGAKAQAQAAKMAHTNNLLQRYRGVSFVSSI